MDVKLRTTWPHEQLHNITHVFKILLSCFFFSIRFVFIYYSGSNLVHRCTHLYAAHGSAECSRERRSIMLLWALRKCVAAKNRNAVIVNRSLNCWLEAFRGSWMKSQSERCLEQRLSSCWSSPSQPAVHGCVLGGGISFNGCIDEWGANRWIRWNYSKYIL